MASVCSKATGSATRLLRPGARASALAGLLRQLDRRFGAVPAAMRERLTQMSESEIEAVGLRLLDARNIDELLN
jgi:hypothetical protein